MENQGGWADLEKEAAQLRKGGGQPKLKTGFQRLDTLLLGGISPGLIVLGGNPGVGKSTLCFQLAEHVVESGGQVMYFSLEMPVKWLLAKSISRRMFQKGYPINAASLMGGDREHQLDEASWNQVEQEKNSEGFQAVLKNLHVWTTPLSASEIRQAVLQYKGSGMGSPLVIVDYLQIVPSEESVKFRSDKEKNDYKVKQFKQLAHEDGFIVILISSLNRGSYTGPMPGAIQMSSFKETGEIEYSADLLLGLQFQNQRKYINLAKEQEKNPREVEISILKNRYGSSGFSVPFTYYAANDCFLEQTVKEGKNASQATGAKEKKADPAGSRQSVWRCVINNTKVANEIREGYFGQQSCRVSGKDKPEVCVQYELSGELSCLDCCVADAIYTVAINLWGNGIPQEEKTLSPKELMKAMTGDPRPTVTSQKLEELRKSIERLQKIQLRLNCEEELRSRGLDGIGPEKLREYQGPFLNLGLRERRGGDWDGTEIFFQKGVCPLFLHSYGAEVNHQMITIPSVLLNVADKRGTMSNTKQNICLKWLLAQRMEIIRRKASENVENLRRISLEKDRGILKALRLSEFQKGEEASKEIQAQKRRRLYESVKRILEYYKQIKYITDYFDSFEEWKKEKKSAPLNFEVIGEIADPAELPQ